MTSPFSQEILLDGKISSAAARERWEQAADSGARRAKVKGKALYLHSRTGSLGTGKYVLHYYQAYGNDFCDAVFTGEIYEYDEGQSQITGKITVSRSMKLFAVLLMVFSFPLALIIEAILYYTTPFMEVIPFMPANFAFNQIFVVAAATISLILIAVMCLFVDKRRVKEIMDYLHEFLREENQ
jgi:hypothetical protein